MKRSQSPTVPEDHPKAKLSRTSDEETSPSFWNRGVTVRGLRSLAEGSEGRSVREMWRNVWIHETVAAGWTVTANYDSDGTWLSQGYRNIDTGETLAKDSGDMLSRGAAPEGCLSLLQARTDLAAELGPPTHFISYPWLMRFEDVVEAIEAALQPDDLVYFDTFARDYHSQRDLQSMANIKRMANGMPLVQVIQPDHNIGRRTHHCHHYYHRRLLRRRHRCFT